ncbi:hypothetical protein MVI01_69420 [Myxococcus virescens]|uniref:Uncharacterized protein n=1 Tax=Myxococcus virescens TaxID=83456 RepID=A0A511HNI4_9BACT|nr:hypothetical protein MVI01_69420 [Myxococcus virescens]
MLAGNFRPDRKRCEETIIPIVGDYSKARELIRRGLLELRESDFAHTETLRDGFEYDAYGLLVSSGLARATGLRHRKTWYVKLMIRVEDGGQLVFCVSFHRLQSDLERNGGVLKPCW